ncbi:hypothetical protein [Streptomyces viridochromogenes]|uniref:Uncharacterized protein n=1 Tax=Streptomyces viridochromogenes Tue57 TaxID=1160705 RepID=L8P3S2_STRVR|nr:hypothetical protein [Streptomyces viridochromogenes]ELS50829.1 hypothetical protein STVIR_8183 [Streptomyces viridochromogenes Tue57]
MDVQLGGLLVQRALAQLLKPALWGLCGLELRAALCLTCRQPPSIFPGYAAGTHRSAATLAAKLRRYQLPVRPSRNTALLALAADLPAAVLSDLLGISITSALQWTRDAARDWNAYLASRQHRKVTRPRQLSRDGQA